MQLPSPRSPEFWIWLAVLAIVAGTAALMTGGLPVALGSLD